MLRKYTTFAYFNRIFHKMQLYICTFLKIYRYLSVFSGKSTDRRQKCQRNSRLGGKSNKKDVVPRKLGTTELLGVLPYHSNLCSSWYGIRTIYSIAGLLPLVKRKIGIFGENRQKPLPGRRKAGPKPCPLKNLHRCRLVHDTGQRRRPIFRNFPLCKRREKEYNKRSVFLKRGDARSCR